MLLRAVALDAGLAGELEPAAVDAPDLLRAAVDAPTLPVPFCTATGMLESEKTSGRRRWKRAIMSKVVGGGLWMVQFSPQ